MPLSEKQEKLRKLGVDIFSEQSLLLFAFFRALKSYIKAAKPISSYIFNIHHWSSLRFHFNDMIYPNKLAFGLEIYNLRFCLFEPVFESLDF